MALSGVSCAGFGGIGTDGTNPLLNEPAPSNARVVASGSFLGLNGKENEVGGSVTIWQSNDTGSYVIHFSGITMPNENPLTIIPVLNGGTATTFTLRASSGSQNYYPSVSASGAQIIWAKIQIYSPATNLNYAEAQLLSPNH